MLHAGSAAMSWGPCDSSRSEVLPIRPRPLPHCQSNLRRGQQQHEALAPSPAGCHCTAVPTQSKSPLELPPLLLLLLATSRFHPRSLWQNYSSTVGLDLRLGCPLTCSPFLQAPGSLAPGPTLSGPPASHSLLDPHPLTPGVHGPTQPLPTSTHLVTSSCLPLYTASVHP